MLVVLHRSCALLCRSTRHHPYKDDGHSILLEYGSPPLVTTSDGHGTFNVAVLSKYDDILIAANSHRLSRQDLVQLFQSLEMSQLCPSRTRRTRFAGRLGVGTLAVLHESCTIMLEHSPPSLQGRRTQQVLEYGSLPLVTTSDGHGTFNLSHHLGEDSQDTASPLASDGKLSVLHKS